jgi:uncharacterized membrane protein YeaQ/YmgE (transglycosylase-associated protein family)
MRIAGIRSCFLNNDPELPRKQPWTVGIHASSARIGDLHLCATTDGWPAASWRAISTNLGSTNMNIIIWLIIGGLIGWVASLVMRTDAQQGVFLNVVVGIVGAVIAGWFISPLVGVPTINQDALSIGSIVVSLIGAVILLAIVNLLRRGAAR